MTFLLYLDRPTVEDTTQPSSTAPVSVKTPTLAELLLDEGFRLKQVSVDELPDMLTLAMEAPDIIVLNVDQPSCQPVYDWLDQLSWQPETSHTPVLLIGHSSHDDMDTIGSTDRTDRTDCTAQTPLTDEALQPHYYLIEGVERGASDYIRAPFHIAELLCKVKALIRSRQAVEKARSVVSQVHEAADELVSRNLAVEKELYMARQLQQSLLPPAVLKPDENNPDGPLMTHVHFENDKLRVSGVYLPCDALGGDLYDIMKLDGGKALGVSIADVSGHGLKAGFITAIYKSSLYRSTGIKTEPGDVLAHLNNELCELVKTSDYVTGLYMHIDLDTLKLKCSGAGHPYPFYYKAADNCITRLEENATPLSWVPDMPYPQDEIQLEPGDKVYMFTDGVTELNNFSGDMFGEARLKARLAELFDENPPFLNDQIITTLSDFTEGAPLADDMSMVLIEVL
ncbi:MAG: SpoIIE family protein phosphatase [Cyanobacteria bacterium HKST-UBA03]|nr:SpoIIE family protein phosphatase [Cyanobacteria bacterium HKST-UBA03]